MLWGIRHHIAVAHSCTPRECSRPPRHGPLALVTKLRALRAWERLGLPTWPSCLRRELPVSAQLLATCLTGACITTIELPTRRAGTVHAALNWSCEFLCRWLVASAGRNGGDNRKHPGRGGSGGGQAVPTRAAAQCGRHADQGHRRHRAATPRAAGRGQDCRVRCQKWCSPPAARLPKQYHRDFRDAACRVMPVCYALRGPAGALAPRCELSSTAPLTKACAQARTLSKRSSRAPRT